MLYNFEKGKLKIDLNEELDMNTCKDLRTIIDGYIMKYQPNECIIDLEEVEFMDSSGIGLIIGRYNLLSLMNSKLTILNATGNIKRMLEISNISNKITMRGA